jgi:aminopeptidase-like protein
MNDSTSLLESEIEHLFDQLWGLNRSITGTGLRDSLSVLGEYVPLERIEVSTGTKVFDWSVPDEWTFRNAYVVTPSGERILDASLNNLHLVSYSEPVRTILSVEDLDQHLHSLPDFPEAIPYVTSYYRRYWGFCLPHVMRQQLRPGNYEVVVDTELKPGSMTLAHALLPGESDQEVLLSTYTCHPSMANNELSGPLVSAFIYRELASKPRRLTYRFVFVPETIGAIAYLSRFGTHLREKTVAGYVITCIGDPGRFTYKRSRQGSTLADHAAEVVLRDSRKSHSIEDFSPLGSDERQYCSPGFNLPVGSLMRTKYGTYREYHTSYDNRDFISFGAMAESVRTYVEVLEALDRNEVYVRTNPYCEPQLGSRQLYPALGTRDTTSIVTSMLWFLNLADGAHSLLDMARRSGLRFSDLYDAAQKCLQAGLVTRNR